jgi:hypothetical protein
MGLRRLPYVAADVVADAASAFRKRAVGLRRRQRLQRVAQRFDAVWLLLRELMGARPDPMTEPIDPIERAIQKVWAELRHLTNERLLETAYDIVDGYRRAGVAVRGQDDLLAQLRYECDADDPEIRRQARRSLQMFIANEWLPDEE